MRHSLDFVSYKDRKVVAAALKDVYRATDAIAGLAALDAFADAPWGRKYPAIAQSWRRAWSEVIPFYDFPDEVTSDRLYNERHRGPERQAAPGGAGERPFSHRRSRNEAAVPGLEPQRKGLENAAPGVGHGEGAIRDPVRSALHQSTGLISERSPPRTRNS